MSIEIDARGLSCPQPVLMALDAIKAAGRGELTILVDTDTAKENVSRSAESRGWTIRDIVEDGDEYRIAIVKE